jgi:3'-5' exoribonuclease
MDIVQEALSFLKVRAEALPEILCDACLGVIEHPKFATQYGSAGSHHGFVGGLAVHTAEVTEYAYKTVQMFPDADEDVVVTAAIFHDFMKIDEYELRHKSTPGTLVMNEYGEPATYIGKTQYRNLIRHVAGSYAKFMVAMEGKDIPESYVLEIGHAILAHHGRYEWGSPVEPQTVEAKILHDADIWSVQFGPNSKRKDPPKRAFVM